MSEGNYIKINRSILEWEWYKNINTKVLFLHMILKANWKEGKFEGNTIERGSFVSSIHKLSEETGLTEREVRTAISHLKKTNELTSKSHNKYTIFTIEKYNVYQASEDSEDKQETDEGQASDKQETSERQANDNNRRKKEVKKGINYQLIVDMYNNTCVSLPCVTVLSEKRKKAIRARLRIYSIDDLQRLFTKAQESNFLKGKNKNNWNADFDWLIQDENMTKVLRDKYINRPEEVKQETIKPANQNRFCNFPQRDYSGKIQSLEQQLLLKQMREVI